LVDIKRDKLGLLVVVGEGMKHAVGTAEAAARALRNAGISISMISQGSSKVSMVFAVESTYCLEGIQAMYKEFSNEYTSKA